MSHVARNARQFAADPIAQSWDDSQTCQLSAVIGALLSIKIERLKQRETWNHPGVLALDAQLRPYLNVSFYNSMSRSPFLRLCTALSQFEGQEGAFSVRIRVQNAAPSGRQGRQVAANIAVRCTLNKIG